MKEQSNQNVSYPIYCKVKDRVNDLDWHLLLVTCIVHVAFKKWVKKGQGLFMHKQVKRSHFAFSFKKINKTWTKGKSCCTSLKVVVLLDSGKPRAEVIVRQTVSIWKNSMENFWERKRHKTFPHFCVWPGKETKIVSTTEEFYILVQQFHYFLNIWE